MKERSELPWLDRIKGVAILWIFCNHVSEQLFGFPLIADPSAHWPPLQERVAQLQWMDGHGLQSVSLNLLRYVGWFGDQGVGLFLILSGFGLTWGLLLRKGSAALTLGPFYRRRAERIYPMWWVAHAFFIGIWLVTGYGLALTDPATYLSLLGIRVTPGLFFYFTPAWWFIGLLIQLYLVYPILWNMLRRWGAAKMLAVSCGVAFLVRLLGLLVFQDLVGMWSLGAVFIARLPEFAVGVFLAARLHAGSEAVDRRLRSLPTVLLAAVAYVAGIGLSLTLIGMTFAPFLTALGMLVLLYRFFAAASAPQGLVARSLAWIGRHSYSLYLAHHPVIQVLLPPGTPTGGATVWGKILAAGLASASLALCFEKAADHGVSLVQRWRAKGGLRGVVIRITLIAISMATLVLGAELAVWRLAPQEVLGWGEKPSLEPHPVFGYRLRPSTVTRLRWESYDYVVTANSLGFPGPEYPVERRPGTLRILVTGDAFSSAEGVNTPEAWPRLLESDLRSKREGSGAEVLNFAITGYGPNEYAAVVRTFGPVYRPDIIIVEFFVNEYEDVLHGPEFVQSIGFGEPSAESWFALRRLTQLQHLVQVRLKEPLVSLLRGKPEDYGYFLGNFSSFERSETAKRVTAQALVAERLKDIKAVADAVGARTMLLLVPAPIQVCAASDLGYFPHHVDLSDTQKFDMDRPQRITKGIAGPLGFEIVDLAPVLKDVSGDCPYQRWNMHWTVAAHRHVARSVANVIASEQQRQGGWPGGRP